MKPLRERLLSKVAIDSGTGCWNWTAVKKEDGYGQIFFNGSARTAHRLSYEIHCGPIPRGVCVCHRCDNPGCVNPDHLFLGLQAENIADMDSKGRRARGNKVANKGRAHPMSKLTEADILAIRAAKGISQRHLAKQYGVSFQQIWRILSGKRWAHIKPHSQHPV